MSPQEEHECLDRLREWLTRRKLNGGSSASIEEIERILGEPPASADRVSRIQASWAKANAAIEEI